MADRNDLLAHYGVKGMHWGVRRSENSGPVSTAIVQKKPGGPVKIKTSKGGGLQPSSDAVKAATFKQRAKKSGAQSLSNEELQTLVTRLNLEKQYKNLQSPPAAQKFVTELLVNGGKQQAQRIVNDRLTSAVSGILKKNGS
jgi:hypothetical protein